MGFVEGNAEKLPFSNDSFDFYTIAFGLRNVTNKEVKRQIHHKLQPEIVVLLKQIALSEAFRVLKSGGKLQILEFSHVQNPVLQRVYDEYSFRVIPPLGRAVAQDAASYQYLVESIRRFPKQVYVATEQSSVFCCVFCYIL
jgi:ubiquinone/menaquinone biosynthesis C-methylase UbiE